MNRQSEVEEIIRSIASQFEVSAGDSASVETGCVRLRRIHSEDSTALALNHLRDLSDLLSKRTGALAEQLFALLEEFTNDAENPWELLSGMLNARDHSLAREALQHAERLAASRKLHVDHRVLKHLALLVEQNDSGLESKEALQCLKSIANCFDDSINNSESDALLDLYLNHVEFVVRRLAARLLDLDESPVSRELSEQVLGPEFTSFLFPYLAYTRASHLDLLSLTAQSGASPLLSQDLRQAESECDESMLRTIISELGWSNLNAGLDIRRYQKVEIDGTLPLHLSPTASLLFKNIKESRFTTLSRLVIAQGASVSWNEPVDRQSDLVGRFRSLNLMHAEMLDDILALSPLTPDVVSRIVKRMDMIVEMYCGVFSLYDNQCSVLTDIYRDLRVRISEASHGQGETDEASPELNRLLRQFEDPTSFSNVHTLHGLKRFLHQRGLQLGFKLVETAQAPGQTITLAVIESDGTLRRASGICYSDFDTSLKAGTMNRFPYSVDLLVENISLQLLYGLQKLPSISIYCYGAEVHYYIKFRNHPVFLRIDYSPPLRGGMIDLQYYGVSKYELSEHPDISLHAVKLFLEKLEFDVSIDATHIHARCDKERILDLDKLCERAASLFRLLPYLMDIDWTIGSLDLSSDAKLKVASAWSDSFPDWGTLPLQLLLTENRCGILLGKTTASGEPSEISWDGEGKYKDSFTEGPPPNVIAKLNVVLKRVGLDSLTYVQDGCRRSLGFARLNRKLFTPLKCAIKRGELIESATQLRRANRMLFQREHEVEHLAAIIHAGGEAAAQAVAIAWLIAPMERSLNFTTTGSIEGCDVQSALLMLRGECIHLSVLRDSSGNMRLGMFAFDSVLYKQRIDENSGWNTNGSADHTLLESKLRSNSLLMEGYQIAMPDARAESELFLSEFESCRGHRRSSPLSGERIIYGLKTSPGRTVARIALGVQGRKPEEVHGQIIVLPNLGPQHNAFIYHCAGIISTSGAALSHAGLIAAQYHKPALIIQGRWMNENSDSISLDCRAIDYEERKIEAFGFSAVIRHDLRASVLRLSDGDLIVLDTEEGVLHVLGQEKETLELYHAIQLLRQLQHQMSQTAGAREILAIRGRRLHALHQLEKTLDQLSDTVVAKHLVLESILSAPQTFDHGSNDDRVLVLRRLLENNHTSRLVKETILQASERLESRYRELLKSAPQKFASSTLAIEIVSLRLTIHRLASMLDHVRSMLRLCGFVCGSSDDSNIERVDELARECISEMRERSASSLAELCEASLDDPRIPHLRGHLARLDCLLGCNTAQETEIHQHIAALEVNNEKIRRRYELRTVLTSSECSSALSPFIGSKAANLAEIQRLITDELVPHWFVVTDSAFSKVMHSPAHPLKSRGAESIESNDLESAIGYVLQRGDLDAEQKAVLIRQLWDAVLLPEALTKEITDAYRHLSMDSLQSESPPNSEAEALVAIRSSACEEDTETDMRAGEFESFLFVEGSNAVLRYLKHAWSGLWTARAIRSREMLGTGTDRVTGGVIIQRAIQSRVSGVLLTVNLADNNMSEMVINVGLGLGEGVVSGRVSTDQIVVDKQRFLEGAQRSYRYTTAEKPEQIIFDRQAGMGTKVKQSLYHQRMRPALEFSELRLLIETASKLEAVFGCPIDIEFAFEGDRLFLLQVRPIPICMSDLRETTERFPLPIPPNIVL